MKKRKTLLFQKAQELASGIVLDAYITAKIMECLKPVASKNKVCALACGIGASLTALAITDALFEMLNESYRHGNATLSVVDDIFYELEKEKETDKSSKFLSILDFGKEK